MSLSPADLQRDLALVRSQLDGLVSAGKLTELRTSDVERYQVLSDRERELLEETAQAHTRHRRVIDLVKLATRRHAAGDRAASGAELEAAIRHAAGKGATIEELSETVGVGRSAIRQILERGPAG